MTKDHLRRSKQRTKGGLQNRNGNNTKNGYLDNSNNHKSSAANYKSSNFNSINQPQQQQQASTVVANENDTNCWHTNNKLTNSLSSNGHSPDSSLNASTMNCSLDYSNNNGSFNNSFAKFNNTKKDQFRDQNRVNSLSRKFNSKSNYDRDNNFNRKFSNKNDNHPKLNRLNSDEFSFRLNNSESTTSHKLSSKDSDIVNNINNNTSTNTCDSEKSVKQQSITAKETTTSPPQTTTYLSSNKVSPTNSFATSKISYSKIVQNGQRPVVDNLVVNEQIVNEKNNAKSVADELVITNDQFLEQQVKVIEKDTSSSITTKNKSLGEQAVHNKQNKQANQKIAKHLIQKEKGVDKKQAIQKENSSKNVAELNRDENRSPSTGCKFLNVF